MWHTSAFTLVLNYCPCLIWQQKHICFVIVVSLSHYLLIVSIMICVDDETSPCHYVVFFHTAHVLFFFFFCLWSCFVYQSDSKNWLKSFTTEALTVWNSEQCTKSFWHILNLINVSMGNSLISLTFCDPHQNRK